ncbi:MAX gene-associated protein isoform X1 [Mixophyes fleayi]|uniref:MAX gene-associated protein isoform X1 n=1 Tax=Mixophyes fleayi TaxID=3061075 RepID=UPI003F4D9367
MEKLQTLNGGKECGIKPPSTTPAYFVILHQSQGDGSKDEGILVANQDVSSVAPFVSNTPDKSKSDIFLSSDCVSKEITVTLDNNNMWNEFYRCSTEMVLTKQGRRMFPYCRYWISGLDPYLKYILVMDITPLDTYRYKWNGKWWEPGGKAEPHVLGRVFIHPESPSTGQYWMHQPVSFYKLKLTNNVLDQDGHIILHSMHRYLPRLHVVPAEKATEVIQLNGPDVHTFTFPQTEFIAVTAYQNFQITQLKIDCNPFAKGFREGAVMGRFTKESKPKNSDQDSAGSKKSAEHDDPESIQKLRELFRMSEYSDVDTENEAFNAERDFLNFMNPLSRLKENSQLKADNPDSFDDHSGVASPSMQPKVEIKQEPEDNYDYNKTVAVEGVEVKREESENDVTDEYSNSDNDYPILERHFAQFRAKPRADRKHSLNSPSGVAKAKLLKLGSGSLPMVYLEPCVTAKNSMELPDLQDPILSENKIQNTEVRDTPLSVESCQISQSPNIISSIEEDISKTDKRKRLSKSKVNAKCDTPQTALSTSCGPKKKLPFLLPKSSVTVTPGNETPIVKKRGRPRKHNVSKVGRPTKKGSPIEAPRLCPDFNPDLEDVDGVLFVAFSSKEALDVHTGEKPKTIGTFSFSAQTDSSGGRAEVRKFAELERQLIAQLRTMRYRQVIHPALQQVGLKLNIVDLTMSIDLRYLGVELPLPRFTDNTRWDNYGLCAQASGFPFVSRTGKTTDYTKIKGWRDKFSMNTTAPPLKIEASRTEHSLKNLSAFCSDELDEYLENEAKLMGDIKGFSQNETVSSISYQLPTKSSSYVRTLDSVLKKQAPHATSSSNSSKPLPLPTKKRKYTRKISAPVTKSKLRPIVPTPVTIKEKVCKRHSAEKKKNTKAHSMNKFTASDLVEYPAPVQRIGKLPVADQKVTVQSSSVPPVEENLLPLLHQAQLQSHQISLKPLGFSKAQMKLMELEECAVWEGKPRTLITEERADISLSTLITAQASLKNKPIYKIINKRTTSCKKEFCRLGCICSSLSHAKHRPTHCCRITCMLGCHCLKSKLYLGKDGFKVKSVRPTQEDAENLQPTKQTDDSPWSAQEEPIENVEDDHKSGASTTKKKKSIDFNDWDLEFRSSKSFPIWNRLDVENDPEPLCIPEKAEFVESKVQHHKGHLEKSKSSSGSKSDRSHTPSTVVNLEEMDPVYLYFDSMMTCARVRAYEHKAPGEKAKKGQCIIDGSDTTGKEHDYKSIKKREREMEDTGEDEVVDKRCRKVDNNGPTKLIEIMSDCSWEQDRSKILNIVSQHMNNREPQSFKVGSFNIELMSEKKSEDKSMSSTTSSRVKISMAPGQKTDQASAKPPVQWGAESVKLPDEKPHDICAEKETKSHGGKGLPFYTKVIPAGKLVARLKNSTINQADLIQVNGKSYPQAKLLLGQMGALHPANRLAAYITHRLRPSLFHLSKLSEINVKMAAKKPPLDSATDGNSKDIMAVEKTATSQQTNSAAQSTSTTQLTQFVKDEVGTLDQKSPGVSSPKPTIPGSPKLTTQSTRLFVTSPVASGKQAPVVAYSSAVNMTSFSPPSLSSVGLGTISPIGNQAASSNPTLIPGTKLVTKDSSFSNQAVFVSSASNEAIHTMTLTSGPSTKKSMSTSSILPSTLVKAITPTLPTSTFTLSMNSGTDKSIATAVAKSLVTSTDVKTHGSVAPLAGTNIAPPMTLKTVTPPSVPTQRPSSVSPGFEKRLGPRLLLIPVPSGSPFRPVQCVQTSPGQKVVLQPIKSPNGANLFRHPNGQIIQLVPLQQVQTGNFQPSSQQVVIRKPGPTVGIRLPLPMKTEFLDPTSASVTSTSISAAPAAVPIATVSKTSPIKSGVTIVPSNPSMLSQFGTLTTTTAMPTTSSEVSRSPSKVVAYTSGGHAVVTSNVIPLQSGGIPVVNVTPPTAPSGSPQISASKAIILMMDKPAVVKESNNEVKPLDNLLSPVVSALSEKLAEEDHIKCERLPCSEMVKIDKKAEVEDNPKASVNFVELGGITQSKEKNGNGNSQNKQRSNVPSQIKAEVADKSSDFDEALLQEVTKKGVRWGQIPKGAQSPITEGDQSPAHKSTLFKKEDTSLIEPGLACDPNQIESIVYSEAEQQILREPGVEVIKSPLLEQSTARSEDFVSTINQEKDESLTVDPLIKVPITDEKDIPDIKKKDEYLIECYSHSEDDVSFYLMIYVCVCAL